MKYYIISLTLLILCTAKVSAQFDSSNVNTLPITARSIKVHLANGSPRDIPTGNIQKRTILEISGMPPQLCIQPLHPGGR
jgi:hypothetical protein